MIATWIFQATLLLFGLTSAAPLVSGTIGKGKYIVTYKPGTDFVAHAAWVADVQREQFEKRGVQLAGIQNVFQSFPTYAGEFDEETVAQIKENPDVIAVEEDQIYEISGQRVHGKAQSRALVTQANPGYHLAAISHRAPGFTDYIYDSSSGAGTWAYVIDTGINIAHEEFEGRATCGYNAIGGPNADENGHGTHVAALLCGKTYGVSKKCMPVAVKVFNANGSGSMAVLLDGLDWTIRDIVGKGRQNRSVINMSVGGPKSTAMNNAVTSAYNSGIVVVVAAGNSNQDASLVSPASAPEAITVGNVDADFKKTSSSNFGSSLDIFAPGQEIRSAYIGSNTATRILSGTSMASPLVAGLVLYLYVLEGHQSPAAVTNRVIQLATTGAVGSAGSGSPNRLAYNGNGA